MIAPTSAALKAFAAPVWVAAADVVSVLVAVSLRVDSVAVSRCVDSLRVSDDARVIEDSCELCESQSWSTKVSSRHEDEQVVLPTQLRWIWTYVVSAARARVARTGRRKAVICIFAELGFRDEFGERVCCGAFKERVWCKEAK
jgi:hypothetical protein